MATVYVDTNKYLDEVTYAQGDTITVRYGAVLTIRKTNTVKPASITTAFGDIRLDSFATGAVLPIVFTFTAASTGFNCGEAGRIIVRGGWHELGTGDGNSGQTFTFYGDNGGVPWVQVETGSGTGVYNDFVGLTNLAMSNIGTGELGRFFSYAESTKTITFGDGTNGVVVPNGAKVRCPDIFITNDAASPNATYSSRNTFGTEYVGYFDVENILLSDRMRLNWIRTSGGSVSGLGTFAQAGITESLGLTIDRVIVAPSNYGNVGLAYSSNIDCVMTNSIICSSTEDAWRPYQNDNCTFTDCKFYALTRDSSGDYPLDLSNSSGMTFTDCTFAGGTINIINCENIKFINPKHSDRMLSTAWTTTSSYAFSLAWIVGLEIDGLTLHPDGCPCYNYVFYVTNGKDYTITNFDYNMENHSAMLLYVLAVNNLVMARGTVGQPRTQLFRGTPASCLNVKIIDVLSTAAGTTTTAPQGRGILLDGFSDAVGGSYSGAFDTPFFNLYDPSATITTGSLYFLAVAPSKVANPSITAGTPFFNNASTVYLDRSGDEVVIESGILIQGVSGFRNLAPTISGTYQSSYTVSYSIKPAGGAWGDWKLLTAANLTGETVSASTGFYFKLKITCIESRVGAAIQTSFGSASIYTNVDHTIKKPYSYVPVTLQNLVVGSSYYVFRTTGGELLFSGTADAAEESSTVVFNSNENITIRVRKPGYKPFETQASLTTSGATSYIIQEVDTIYQ